LPTLRDETKQLQHRVFFRHLCTGPLVMVFRHRRTETLKGGHLDVI
jgi:hypothetical protein